MSRSVHLVPFSPTGSTRRTLENIAAGMSGATVSLHDLTFPAGRASQLSFSPSDLVLIGMPVYYGRVPKPFHAGLPLVGNGAAALYVAVYGNRDYDDALLELQHLGEQAGFVSLGAAAFIAEHSLNGIIATGRPDAADADKAAAFGREALTRMAALKAAPAPLLVRGKTPYRNYGAMPPPQLVPDACIACGQCFEACPMAIIDGNDFSLSDASACISCHACIKSCPVAARDLGPAEAPVAEKMAQLAAACQARKEPEIFWA